MVVSVGTIFPLTNKRRTNMIPTIEQVMKCYQSIAQTERMKTGRPGEETVANAL